MARPTGHADRSMDGTKPYAGARCGGAGYRLGLDKYLDVPLCFVQVSFFVRFYPVSSYQFTNLPINQLVNQSI